MLELLHRNLQAIWERSSLEMLSLNQKRLLKQFLDWKITLMLHWGSLLLKQLFNLDLKLKKKTGQKTEELLKYLF